MAWIEKEGRSVEEATAAAIAEARLPEDQLEIEVVREGAKGLFGLGGEPALVRVRAKAEARDVRGAFRDDLSTPAGATLVQHPAPADSRAASDAPPRTAEAENDAPPRLTEAGEAPPQAGEDEDDVEDGRTLAERQEAAAQVGVEMVEGILTRMGLDGEVQSRIEGGTVYIDVFGDDMGILIGRAGATLEALQELVRAGVQRRVKARQALVVDVEAYWDRRRQKRRPDQREGDGRTRRQRRE